MGIPNYSEYKVIQDYTKEDEYTEASQVSKIKFGLCWVDHDNRTIIEKHRPMKCREYLADWVVAHNSKSAINIYRFRKDAEDSALNPLQVLTVHGTKEDLGRTQYHCSLMKEFRNLVFTSSNPEILILAVPENVFRSPLGIQIFTLFFRSLWFSSFRELYSPNYGRLPLNIPLIDCSERSIILATSSTVPIMFLVKLIFDPNYAEFLLPVSVKSKLVPNSIHESTGPQAISHYIAFPEARRKDMERSLEEDDGYGDVVNMKRAVVFGLRKFYN